MKQMEMINKLGSMGSILKMLPGMGGALRDVGDLSGAEDEMKRMKIIVQSMTKKERDNYKIIKDSHVMRIARGSGNAEKSVRDFLQKFAQMEKMMGGMAQMMKGGGRAIMAVKDPTSDQNYVYDEDGNSGTDDTMFTIYRALQQADTVANRLRTGDMEEAKRIGMNSLSDFQEAETLIRSDMKPPGAGGLKYMTSMVEAAAAHIFITKLIRMIQSM